MKKNIKVMIASAILVAGVVFIYNRKQEKPVNLGEKAVQAHESQSKSDSPGGGKQTVATGILQNHEQGKPLLADKPKVVDTQNSEPSESASAVDEQRADQLMDQAKDEKSPFAKDFDIEKTSCSGSICRIDAVAHPGASPGNVSVLFQFMAAHPEYGTNYDLKHGDGQAVSFYISKDPFKK